LLAFAGLWPNSTDDLARFGFAPSTVPMEFRYVTNEHMKRLYRPTVATVVALFAAIAASHAVAGLGCQNFAKDHRLGSMKVAIAVRKVWPSSSLVR
jgi:hypothetical protein